MKKYKLHIGIDGGGSGSRFAFRVSGSPLITSPGPELQGSLLSPESIAERIILTITRVMGEHRLEGPFQLHAGIAGCGNRARAAAVKAAIEGHFKGSAAGITSDVAATFAACFGLNINGNALLICGTGSVLVYGKQDRLHMLGGYGPEVYESGSGRQIGRDTITLLTQSMVSDTPDETLIEALSEVGFEVRSRKALLDHLYNSGTFNAASLAPACLVLAGQGHRGCREIMNKHFSHLTDFVHTARRANTLTGSLAYHGGLFKNGWFLDRFKQQVGLEYTGIRLLKAPEGIEVLLSSPKFTPLPAETVTF